MIEFNKVTKVYKNKDAIKDLSLTVNKGDFVFITGPSGAGKSTLLNLIYGELKPDSGSLLVDKLNIKNLKSKGINRLREKISVVFQDYNLLEELSVFENIALLLKYQGYKSKDIDDATYKMISALNLEQIQETKVLNISGGEKQRVALGRALLKKPQIILADEPTGNLDSKNSSMVFDLLLEANSAGSTVIVATHNLSIIQELNLRTVVIDQGVKIADYKHPRKVV